MHAHSLLALAILIHTPHRDTARPSKPVHQIRRWSGRAEDETPVCGRPIPKTFASRTIYTDAVTCPECQAAGVRGPKLRT